jgi:excisionase family DNA binding protein
MEQTLLEMEDVSKRLNIAKSTLYNHVKNDAMPFIKIGGKLLFSEKAIDEWVLANTHNNTAKGKRK